MSESRSMAALLMAGLLILPVTARAQGADYHFQTGADLQHVCANPANAKEITAAERERLLICGAYIQGYLAHYGVARQNMKRESFCLPAQGTTGEKVRLLFNALLQKKPQIRDLPASINLATALAWGYPCNKTAGASVNQ